MERWQNKIAVVTGASSGIGAKVATDLVENGFIVAALARRKELVEKVRETLQPELRLRFHAVNCDVCDLNSVNEAFDWIVENLGGVDVLVNNAGTLIAGHLLTQDIAEVQQVLQTNVMGVIYCTRRAFKSMQERSFDGHVVLVNSILGHSIYNNQARSLPDFNVYPPSKYAVTAINEVFRQEFRGFGTRIKVTSVSPGIVDTAMVPADFKGIPMLNPEDISNGILYALGTPPHVQVHELTIKPLGEMC